MSEPEQTELERLNALGNAAAEADLGRCCGASLWAHLVAARRPFADTSALRAASEAAWPALTEADWREAFTHHPKIGDIESLRGRYAHTRDWAAGEQAGAQGAADDVLEALAAGNAAYEARFGYLFIVCATGKGAAEMLALLRERLPNDPGVEIGVAAEEQKKITRLRLDKLFGP